jgi:hypothetical protein
MNWAENEAQMHTCQLAMSNDMEQQLPSIVGSKQQPIGQLVTGVKAPRWRNQ